MLNEKMCCSISIFSQVPKYWIEGPNPENDKAWHNLNFQLKVILNLKDD